MSTLSREAVGPAREALVVKLIELFGPILDGWTVKVYDSLDDGDGYRIHEIDLCCPTAGESWQRSNACAYTLALILSSEDFVRSFHAKAFRPKGWESDLDEHADDAWKLEQVVKEMRKP
jgi:hypothetical protein